MLKTLRDYTYQETSDELNRRGYYPAEEPIPLIQPVTTPVTTPATPPVPPVPFLERYGKLVVFGFIGLFLIAIYPGGEK